MPITTQLRRMRVGMLFTVVAALTSTTLAAQPAENASQPAARSVAVSANDTTPVVAAGREAPPSISIAREVFSYAGKGRRDPYTSLMSTGELRPLVSDLRLTAVAFDPLGKNSVAILRDLQSEVQYRVRVGQSLGRLRVANIRQKSVIFSIEEFGFSRQETLSLTSDSTTTRTR